ncbi:glucan endo-1,3-beta-glucosidase 8-like [Primulina eburnea]|uniref:glucan endo-1,3-beta-glucosidase 8-like n=1 Tax=Primulina eburnea TaxID=1245227 RepID=UPI003C6C9169
MTRGSSCVIMLMMQMHVIMWVDMIVLAEGGRIGINWGRVSYQKMMPSMVVDLLLQNEIKEVRIFNPAGNVLEAFTGTRGQLAVSISIPNDHFYKVNTTENALQWVDNWITTFKQRINMRYVIVGTDPFSISFVNKTRENNAGILKMVQDAVNARGYGMEIKVSTPQYTDMINTHLNTTLKPSEAEFLPQYTDMMTDYLRLLQKNKAPVMLNLSPLQYVQENNLDINFAFMDKKSSYIVRDNNGLVYDNAFEFLYDSFLWAMKKSGFDDMKLVVTQIGWPTDALQVGTVTNAERFYASFLPYISSNRGTPLKPGLNIDVFLHSLSDENKVTLDWGPFQRHWGIYQFNGEPKFRIDFTGQGREIWPSIARGFTYMPTRWCVFNGDMRDNKTVSGEVDKCCNLADCSSLEEGGSCSHLDYKQKVSYAFNRYFQTRVTNQTDICYMKGFGHVVYKDPSDGRCSFPIEIIAAERKQRLDEFLGERSTSDDPEEYYPAAASVPRGDMVLQFTILIFLPLLIIYW